MKYVQNYNADYGISLTRKTQIEASGHIKEIKVILVSGVAKLESNVAKFSMNVAKLESNVAKFSMIVAKLIKDVAKYFLTMWQFCGKKSLVSPHFRQSVDEDDPRKADKYNGCGKICGKFKNFLFKIKDI